MPYNVCGHEHEPYYRPGSYLIGGRTHNGDPLIVNPAGCIARVRSLIIYRFNYVIPSVKSLVADKLYAYLSVGFLHYSENSHILVFPWIYGNLKHYEMYVAIDIVNHLYIIYITITIEVKVINIILLIIQISLESFKSL